MQHRHTLSIKKLNDLWSAILALKTKPEAWKFFRDLCTVEELTAMADRWQAVKMIKQGIAYRTIAERLKMSSTTVARVAYWFKYGKGGYRLMVKRLKVYDSKNK